MARLHGCAGMSEHSMLPDAKSHELVYMLVEKKLMQSYPSYTGLDNKKFSIKLLIFSYL